MAMWCVITMKKRMFYIENIMKTQILCNLKMSCLQFLKKIERREFNQYGQMHRKTFYSRQTFRKIMEEYIDQTGNVYCRKFLILQLQNALILFKFIKIIYFIVLLSQKRIIPILLSTALPRR